LSYNVRQDYSYVAEASVTGVTENYSPERAELEPPVEIGIARQCLAAFIVNK